MTTAGADPAVATVRVLVADDQTVVRRGLVSMIDATEGFEVVAEVSDGEGAVAQAVVHRPDVVLLDVRMPGIGGIEAARQIVAEHRGGIKVLMITTPRHHHPVRCPRDRYRPGDRALPVAAPPPGVPALPAQVARAYPAVELHLVMDNYAAHKHPAVQTWLTANPRVKVHNTATSASWLNLVECWFSIIERQAIHRGSYASVTELNQRIRVFIDGWNHRCHPFVWTKTAEQVLAKANRKKTSDAGH